MARKKPFNLLARIFGLESAQHAPTAWHYSFLHEHLDVPARTALFRTCRAGRDFVLSTARHATLTLTVPSNATAMHRSLRHAAEALLHRGGSSAALVVRPSTSDHRVGRIVSAAAFQTIRQHLLAVAGQHISQLHVKTDCVVYTQVFQAALPASFLTATPLLHTLHIDLLSRLLPCPVSLPQLRHLHVSIYHASQAVCSSVGLYLPQLAAFSLTACKPETMQPVWHAILNPATTSHTLKHFTTNQTLDDHLLPLLLQHAPNVQHLSVHAVGLSTEHHAEAQWQVKTLTVTGYALYGVNLCGLPASRTRPLRFRWTHQSGLLAKAIRVFVGDEEGLSEAMQRHLGGAIAFEGLAVVNVQCGHPGQQSLDVEARLTDLLAGLPNALRQISRLQSSTPWRCMLKGWDLTQRVLDSLAETAAALPQLTLGLEGVTLDDTLVSHMIRHPHTFRCSKLVVDQVILAHDHSGHTWECHELKAAQVRDSLDLLRLPRDAEEGAKTTLRLSKLVVCLSPEEVANDVPRLKQRLSTFDIKSLWTVEVACPADDLVASEHWPAMMTASLDLAHTLDRACRDANSKSAVSLEPHWSVEGWDMTVGVTRALADGLPEQGNMFVTFSENVHWFPVEDEDSNGGDDHDDDGGDGQVRAAYQRLGAKLAWAAHGFELCSPCSMDVIVTLCRGAAEVLRDRSAAAGGGGGDGGSSDGSESSGQMMVRLNEDVFDEDFRQWVEDELEAEGLLEWVELDT